MMARGRATVRALRSRGPKMSLREETETRLRPLLGRPLSDMWRAAGMQVLEFGEQRPAKNRRGQEITRADRSLHVSCCWLIEGPNGEIVSSDDFGPQGARRDERAHPFYEMLGDPILAVRSIASDEVGGIKLGMSEGFGLTVRPCWDGPFGDDDTEQWRYLPADEEERHFVIRRDGVERY